MHVELPHQEFPRIHGLIDRLGNGQSRRMAGVGIVSQQNGPVRRRGRLKPRRHFARVQGINARIAIPGYQKHGGIFSAGLYVLIRRIGGEMLELRGIVGSALLGNPILQCQAVISCFFSKHFATYVGRPLLPI